MVKIDNGKCIGCGLCAQNCPSVFEMDGSKAKVKSQKESDCVEDAISECPVSAISK